MSNEQWGSIPDLCLRVKRVPMAEKLIKAKTVIVSGCNHINVLFVYCWLYIVDVLNCLGVVFLVTWVVIWKTHVVFNYTSFRIELNTYEMQKYRYIKLILRYKLLVDILINKLKYKKWVQLFAVVLGNVKQNTHHIYYVYLIESLLNKWTKSNANMISPMNKP